MNDAVVPQWGWMSWSDAGKVEQLESEAIVTEFFHFIVPVRAGKTFYRFRTRAGEASRFEIPRHKQSVVLGYLRTPLWLAAVILAAPACVDFARWGLLLPIAIALAGIAAVLTFVVGKLDPGERERRELLQRAVGVGAPPELLPADMLDEMREDLAEAWFHEHQTDWRDAIYRGVGDEMLVALAEYHRSPQLLIRARTNLIDAEGN